MEADLLIKNGHVIDPSQGLDCMMDIAVKDGRIISVDDTVTADEKNTLDAASCIVTPGLVDFHAHFYYQATDSGIPADLAMIPNGVTAAIDAGCTGVSSCRGFFAQLDRLNLKSKIALHVNPSGQATFQYPEPYYPEKWDAGRTAAVMEKYGNRIAAFKMRTSKNVVFNTGMRPFYAALEWAARFDRRLIVHVSDPPATQSEIASALRPGDIFCHVYQGKGETIIENGHVVQAVLEARERGVLFDAAHGNSNFTFRIADQAMGQGFAPDIISTDLTSRTLYKSPILGLPFIMSKFLLIGMPLKEIIRAASTTPAKAAGMEGQWGTLKAGTCADISIFKLKNKNVRFYDCEGAYRDGEQILFPMATILDGIILYRNFEL